MKRKEQVREMLGCVCRAAILAALGAKSNRNGVHPLFGNSHSLTHTHTVNCFFGSALLFISNKNEPTSTIVISVFVRLSLLASSVFVENSFD